MSGKEIMSRYPLCAVVLVGKQKLKFSGADLHLIGGLVPLLGYLKNFHANIRAKAAEVVSTIVQNNSRSQQLVMEANGVEPLLSNFTSDPDVTALTKAQGAISWVFFLLMSGLLVD
ncbi:hypothetical protein CQW23_12669 [Capsicum baccatum]|uniref:Uncharacterized protein n=1 Tax=Capsicum baccatum TaxID=33114 RepID=A0A2G2WTE7_CAPBA|nr:hypothetical protein CQW23_12669 [Capsicum baccatum]